MGASNPIPRVLWLAALGSAVLGTGLEIAAHQLLSARGPAAWLIKPYLYVGLPKPFVHTDWLNVGASAIVALGAICLIVAVGMGPAKPAPLIWLALGLILGGSVGQGVTGIALGSSTSIFVASVGARGFAFSPYTVVVSVGVILAIPEMLVAARLAREPKGDFRWRDLWHERGVFLSEVLGLFSSSASRKPRG